MNRVISPIRRLSSGMFSSVAIMATLVLSACGGSDSPTMPSNPATDTYASALGVSIANMTKKSDALYYQDVVVGTGAEAIAGRLLGMNYTGYLVNGSKFDTNVGKNLFSFTLGAKEVIAGWDQGIAGMKVGGKRKIVIGSTLAYGASGSGAIGPNATLVFDVELVTVK